MSTLQVRRACPSDAAGIVNVLSTVAAERIYSAIEVAWSVEQETRYLESLSSREAVHGLQSLDLWSGMLPSMAQVGQLGTFVLPEWRGRGAGRLLWGSTEPFARAAGYRKLVIQVRASNLSAQAFYRTTLGFRECGRLSRQVVIDGIEDDEILMARFL